MGCGSSDHVKQTNPRLQDGSSEGGRVEDEVPPKPEIARADETSLPGGVLSEDNCSFHGVSSSQHSLVAEPSRSQQQHPITFGSPVAGAGEQSADAFARHQLYMQSKKERKKARDGNSMSEQLRARNSCGAAIIGQGAFLSNLPEIDVDIEYRFAVVIMGVCAVDCILAALRSSQFLEVLPADPSMSMANQVGDYRMLSTVPYPERVATKRKKMCKLILKPARGNDDVPTCQNRFDALSTALLFTFVVDPMADERSFCDQMQDFESMIDSMRSRKRKLRCARAVLFLRHSPVPEEDGKGCEKWEILFNELELVHGGMWKFGPVQLSDTDELYSVFATTASTRIVRLQTSAGSESDGSHCSELPPLYEAQMDDHSVRSSEVSDVDDSPKPVNLKHTWLTPMQRGAA